MVTSENILMSLVRSALWQSAPTTDGFPLGEAEWHHLHFLAQKQTVQGIVFDAVCRLPEDLLPPPDLFQVWMQEARATEFIHQQHIRALAWLTTRIEAESSLRPIILKGLPLASLYPIPSHRVSGDIDVYYGSEDVADTADRLVESWGNIVTKGKNSESVFALNGVPIEHHGYLTLSHVPWRKKRLTNWIEHTLEEEGSTREIMVDNIPVRVLSPMLDLIQLSSHNLKHSLNEGIGLRQLCDLALFVSHNHDQLQASPLRQQLSRFGLQRWTALCLSYCTRYLGLPSEMLPYPVKTSQHTLTAMHEEVMQSGNFGQMDERYSHDSDSNQSATAQRITQNVWRYFRLSPMESLCWYVGLIGLRLKEKIWKKEHNEEEEKEKRNK